jgi:hypothetical protein
MVLRVAGLPVWVGPSEVVAGIRAAVGWTDEAVELVAGLPARAARLLDELDGLVRRVTEAVDEVEDLLGRVDGVAGSAAEMIVRVDTVVTGAAAVTERAGGVVDDAARTTQRAGAVIEQAATTGTGAGELLELYRPVAERAAPLARRFVEEFSEAELHAAIRMIDQLPQLTHHIETDVIPILTTLDRVGPDVHQLLEVLQDVRLAIQGVPGFRMLRRWGERDEPEADRSD